MSTDENLVLIGFMGSGKSSIGRLIASRLGYRFEDTDQLIVRAAGRPISAIFAAEGEERFRDLEAGALESLATGTRQVVATGGGIVLREANRAALQRLGFVVWLDAREEVIFERVSRNDRRPLLRTEDPRATIHRLLAERRPLYAAAAHFSLDTSDLTHAQATDAVISQARRRVLCHGAE